MIARAGHGVERRVLHLGNILNNGYLNAKVLRRAGWDAVAVGVDYWHVQGQPEWDEVEIIDPQLSHFDPDWRTIDLRGFTRPWWFHDPLLAQLPEAAAHIERREPADYHRRTPEAALNAAASKPTGVPPGWRSSLGRILERVGVMEARRAARAAQMKRSNEVDWQRLVDAFARSYPDREKQLTAADVADHTPRALAHRPLFNLFPLIQASGLDPVNVLLADPDQPFVCYEHGTLRDFPYEDSSRGRLYALAVQLAQHVIITNQDVNVSAARLGLTNYSYIPHVVDEEIFQPAESPRRRALQQQHGCNFVIVAPARHHWKHAPAGMENSWFKRNDIAIRGLGRLFERKPDLKALVVFFEWGQEVELSKALIRECGFADRVRWEPICSKRVMRDFYNAADVVLDQFNTIGAFGTVVPESLACGRPVILNYQRDRHVWCFGEPPPCINAETEEQVDARVGELLDDMHHRQSVGRAGYDWFMRHHSTRVVAEKHIAVYLKIADRFGWKWSS